METRFKTAMGSGAGMAMLAGQCVLVGLVSLLCHSWVSFGGELTIEGNMTVKTNLVVQGHIHSAALVLTNLAISGQATIQEAVIQHLVPQGDLSMGPFTNRTDR